MHIKTYLARLEQQNPEENRTKNRTFGHARPARM